MLTDGIHFRLAFIFVFLGKCDFLAQLTDDIDVRFGYDSCERCMDDILAYAVDNTTMDDFHQFRWIADSLGYEADNLLVTFSISR